MIKEKRTFKINYGFLNFGQLSIEEIGHNNKIVKITLNDLNKEMNF